MHDVIGEREALTDILNGEKNMLTLYTTALIESSSPEMRALVQQGMAQIAQDQYGVYSNMATRGYYPIEAAPQNKIAQAVMQFEGVRQQL